MFLFISFILKQAQRAQVIWMAKKHWRIESASGKEILLEMVKFIRRQTYSHFIIAGVFEYAVIT